MPPKPTENRFVRMQKASSLFMRLSPPLSAVHFSIWVTLSHCLPFDRSILHLEKREVASSPHSLTIPLKKRGEGFDKRAFVHHRVRAAHSKDIPIELDCAQGQQHDVGRVRQRLELACQVYPTEVRQR